MRSIFLDATTEALVRRFSETRRRASAVEADRAGTTGAPSRRALFDAIELERQLLAALREAST